MCDHSIHSVICKLHTKKSTFAIEDTVRETLRATLCFAALTLDCHEAFRWLRDRFTFSMPWPVRWVCFTRHSQVRNSRFAFILVLVEAWVLDHCSFQPCQWTAPGDPDRERWIHPFFLLKTLNSPETVFNRTEWALEGMKMQCVQSVGIKSRSSNTR